MKNNIKILLLAAISFVACEKDEDIVVVPEVPITAGEANFSKYVAVGNSLTAGFSDNALFKAGQLGSWTNVLNEQFKLVEGAGKGTEFKIPFMPDNNIGGILFGATLIQNPRVVWNGAGVSPVGTPTSQATDRAVGTGFNNFGVPGAKSFHLITPGYGNLANFPNVNPYFARFCSTPNATIINDAVAQNSTFFSLWIGNNDVLSYATSGGIGTNQTGTGVPPQNYGGNDITDPALFDGVYKSLINGNPSLGVAKGLASDGAQGVVCTIPYVTSVPFFTTVLPNQIPPFPSSKAADAAQLNTFFGVINQITTAATLPTRFTTLTVNDNNPSTTEINNQLLIVDQTLTDLSVQITSALTPVLGAATAGYLGGLYGQARHAKSTGARDYILLTTGAILRDLPVGNNLRAGAPAPFNINGVSYPLLDGEVLTNAEAAEVKVATDAYNATIKGVANAKIAVVDTNKLLQAVASGGVSSNGYTITSTYPTGGGFSLDGVHPCPRGYALITNEVIRVINEKFKSSLRPVDITKYKVQYPRVITN